MITLRSQLTIEIAHQGCIVLFMVHKCLCVCACVCLRVTFDKFNPFISVYIFVYICV